MERIRNLGLALIVLGVVELAWVAFCVFGGLVLGLVGFADRDLGPMLWVLSGAYALLALGCVPIAALHVYAGLQLRKGRGFLLTIVALAAGLVSLVFALYCSPLTLIVCVYGAVVLLDPEVRKILDPPPTG